MALTNLSIPPGVSASGTQHETQGRWWRGNLVRWRNGLLQPVGGWQRLPGVQFNVDNGPPRGSTAWRDNQLKRYLAIGTPANLYVYSDTGAVEDITPAGLVVGRADAIYGAGFGFGPFGMEEFGTVRTTTGDLLDASVWSLDNWGQNLVAMMNTDTVAYEWEPGDPEALPIANAPTGNGMFVTNERHLVIFGAGGNPRRVAWSDREDNTAWTPTATNLAGDFELRTDGRIVAALRLKGENLLLTSADAYNMVFLGAPLVYGFNLVGRACGVFGPGAAVSANSFAVWMGPAGWHLYDGALRPLPSEVHGYVYSDINLEQASKVVAGLNDQFNEIWWLYPSSGSTEIDRYVTWNYVENHWSVGELERTTWTPEGVFSRPLLAGLDGRLYEHEAGWTADGEAIAEQRFVESGAVGIDAGDRVAVVTRLVPDEASLGQTRAIFKARFAPNGPETAHGPFDPAAFTDMRLQGRQVALRIEGVADADWRIGLPRLDIKAGGRR